MRETEFAGFPKAKYKQATVTFKGGKSVSRVAMTLWFYFL